MIVDTSALIAVLLSEPERHRFIETLGRAASVKMSTGSWIELGIVLENKRVPDWPDRLSAIADAVSLGLMPVTIEQAKVAHDAYRRFGRRSGNRARLNFGDCFSYALAKTTGEPLLFKGDDFTHTDVTPAI